MAELLVEVLIESRSCGRSIIRPEGKVSLYMMMKKEEQGPLIMTFTGCLERVQMGMRTAFASRGWRDSTHPYPGEDQQIPWTTDWLHLVGSTKKETFLTTQGLILCRLPKGATHGPQI